MDEANRIALQDREKVERQNQQLSDYEAEINLLRRRVEGLENDKDRDRRQINQLTDNINRARMVFQCEDFGMQPILSPYLLPCFGKPEQIF